jgi:hypothetical protein
VISGSDFAVCELEEQRSFNSSDDRAERCA